MIEIPGFAPIEPDHTRLVLEAGPCNHDIKYALDAVDAAGQSGAWGFKVQLYRADRLVQDNAPRYDRTGGEAVTQHQAFRNAIPYGQWEQVKEACDRNGLVFFASPFDFYAVDVLDGMGVQLFKVASGDITHKPLLQKIAATGKPIILSTGAATLIEIRDALQWIQDIDHQIPVCLLVCTLSYPCNPEDAHIRRVTSWLEAGQQMVGYSDHTRGVDGPLIAAQLGAVMVEKHFTLRKNLGYDSDFAVDTLEAAQIVRDMGNVKFLGGHPMMGLPDLGPIPAEQPALVGARRSVVAARHITPGETFQLEDLDFLRPATGLAPVVADEIVGCRVLRELWPGQPISRKDFKRPITARLDVF